MSFLTFGMTSEMTLCHPQYQSHEVLWDLQFLCHPHIIAVTFHQKIFPFKDHSCFTTGLLKIATASVTSKWLLDP